MMHMTFTGDPKSHCSSTHGKLIFLFPVFYQFLEVHRLRLKLLSSSATGAVENELLPYTKFFSTRKGKRFIGCVLFGVSSVINYF
ncbi:hypothetical protein Tco_0470299, partial [Tanacetum coccineum]